MTDEGTDVLEALLYMSAEGDERDFAVAVSHLVIISAHAEVVHGATMPWVEYLYLSVLSCCLRIGLPEPTFLAIVRRMRLPIPREDTASQAFLEAVGAIPAAPVTKRDVH